MNLGYLIPVLFGVLLSMPALAQDATPADRAAVARCLAEKVAAGEDQIRCVGVIADACLEKSKDPSTQGMADCSRREYAVWDERLNTAYRKLLSDLEPNERAKVRDMERSWVAFHEKKCGLHRELEEGSIVIPIEAYCFMVEVGRQAVFVEQLLGDSR